MSKALGIDESVNTCDCCGKTNLKSTVVIELDSGDLVNYGSVCAKRNTGKATPQINKEIKEEKERVLKLAVREWKSSPEYLAKAVRYAECCRAKITPGKPFMEFVKSACDAGTVACKKIAEKYKISMWEII